MRRGGDSRESRCRDSELRLHPAATEPPHEPGRHPKKRLPRIATIHRLPRTALPASQTSRTLRQPQQSHWSPDAAPRTYMRSDTRQEGGKRQLEMVSPPGASLRFLTDSASAEECFTGTAPTHEFALQ